MTEYIEREKVLEEASKCGLAVFNEFIKLPKADVAPLRHAKWIAVDENSDILFCCSRCGCEISTSWDYDTTEWNFCPRCGCAMDGGVQ